MEGSSVWGQGGEKIRPATPLYQRGTPKALHLRLLGISHVGGAGGTHTPGGIARLWRLYGTGEIPTYPSCLVTQYMGVSEESLIGLAAVSKRTSCGERPCQAVPPLPVSRASLRRATRPVHRHAAAR